jgi:pimeloyl-ACP methyl ester carboxylesterase
MRTLILSLLALVAALPALAASNHGYNSYNPETYDVCQTQYTMQHYMQGKCFEIERPVQAGGESFKLRAVLLAEDLSKVSQQPTLVMIPGGPGESSGMLRYVLNEKDMLNGIIKHLGLNVVLFDPRGTGSSKFSKPVSEYDPKAVSTELMTEDLLALVNSVSPDKPVYLMSHSAGGSVAVQLALRAPERISGMLLASSSTSPRQMALINLGLISGQSALWERFLKDPAHAALPLAELDRKYQESERAVIQQQKARILKQFVHPGFPKISVPMWRDQVLLAAESDPSGQAVAALVENFYRDMTTLENASGQSLAPAALEERKLSEADMVPLDFKGGEWIKAAVMCGEGLTAKELETPTYLDGITMARFCNNIHAASEKDLLTADLTKVKVPVLFVGGQNDTQVPPYIAREIVSQLPNATLILDAKSGHAVFYENPVTFYKAVEKFVR